MSHKNNKDKTLEKEIAELKDDVENAKMMIESMNRMIQSLRGEIEVKECKHKEDDEVKNKEKRMEKEVCDLKVEVSTLKQMFAKLYTLFQNNKNKPDVKRNENKSENDEVQETQKIAIEKSKGLEAKLKCDKCEYETNKRITLVKHKNTKHGQTEKNQEI